MRVFHRKGKNLYRNTKEELEIEKVLNEDHYKHIQVFSMRNELWYVKKVSRKMYLKAEVEEKKDFTVEFYNLDEGENVFRRKLVITETPSEDPETFISIREFQTAQTIIRTKNRIIVKVLIQSENSERPERLVNEKLIENFYRYETVLYSLKVENNEIELMNSTRFTEEQSVDSYVSSGVRMMHGKA